MITIPMHKLTPMQTSITKILIAISIYSLCVQAIETKVNNLRGTDISKMVDGTVLPSTSLIFDSSTHKREQGSRFKNLRYLSSKPSNIDTLILDELETSKESSQRSWEVDEDLTSTSTKKIHNSVMHPKNTAVQQNDSWDIFLQKEQAAVKSIVQNERLVVLSSNILTGISNDKNESQHNVNWDNLEMVHQSIPETRASNINIRSRPAISHEMEKESSRSMQFE